MPHRYSSVRHTHITEDIKKTIATTQAEVKDAMTTTNKQLVVLESKLEELNLSSDDEEAAGPEEGKTEALRQFEERKAVSASQRLLDELLSKAQEDAVAKTAAKNQGSSTTVTSVTFGNQNSGQQAGVINGGTNFWAK